LTYCDYAAAVMQLLSFLVIWLCLVSCELWTKQDGVASENGTLYPYTSLSECLKLCLEVSTCVAVDVSVYACVVHTTISDITTKFNASSFAQYTLHRECQTSIPSSASVTTRTASTQISTQSTQIG